MVMVDAKDLLVSHVVFLPLAALLDDIGVTFPIERAERAMTTCDMSSLLSQPGYSSTRWLRLPLELAGCCRNSQFFLP